MQRDCSDLLTDPVGVIISGLDRTHSPLLFDCSIAVTSLFFGGRGGRANYIQTALTHALFLTHNVLNLQGSLTGTNLHIMSSP